MSHAAARTPASSRDLPPLAVALAEQLASFTPDRVTSNAAAWTKAAITDTVGCTLAGANEPCATILRDTPGITEAPGPALVFGTRRRTSALDATLINGVASHAHDFDDVNGHMGGHPSAMLLPAVIAVSEGRKVSGRALMEAFIVGYELQIRMARALNFHHYDKGWHPTATIGVFGAAAAASRLLGLDVPTTARALSLAASFASGIKANFGTMTKPLHVGHGGRNGVFAAFIAQRGFTSNPAALEHSQGFLDVYNGRGNYDIDRLLADWYAPLEIEDSSNGLKQYPCCGSTHPAIMMMQQLKRDEPVSPETVDRIDILAHRRRLPHTDNPDPQSPLGAKFSQQYTVARALASGAVRISDFEGTAFNDADVRRIMALTTAAPHPDMPADGPNQFGAEVVVTLKSGQRVSRRVDHVVCRGPLNAMSDAEMFEKFSDCARRALPANRVAPLFERLQTLDTVSDVGQITRLVEA